MLKILKNVNIYSPRHLGRKNIFVANGKIEDIFDGEKYSGIPVEDMEGMYAFPGFIDGHVHVIGGGGEGGFSSRIEEIKPSDLLGCGVTGVIGLLGTDSVTRSLTTLFAKTMSLREKGIDAYMVTGSYSYPVKTITGSIERDIVLIEPVIGVGELAISDRRGSAIDVKELRRISHEVYVSSILSGKKGKIIVHVGNSPKKLSLLFETVEDEETNPLTFILTHVNRNYDLLEEAARWVKRGGYVDLTGCSPNGKAVCVHEALNFFSERKVDLTHVTVSSDAQGSLPIFDEEGNFTSMGISKCSVLLDSFKECVKSGIDIEQALKPFTSNVADFFGFNNGKIERGRRADLIFLDPESLELKKVMVKGNFFT